MQNLCQPHSFGWTELILRQVELAERAKPWQHIPQQPCLRRAPLQPTEVELCDSGGHCLKVVVVELGDDRDIGAGARELLLLRLAS